MHNLQRFHNEIFRENQKPLAMGLACVERKRLRLLYNKYHRPQLTKQLPAPR
jgi:hypothetical protein